MTCQPSAHVFTPLYPGYEPDDQTPCDCGAQSWRESKIARLRATVEARLEREAQKRRTPDPPGPDPNVCSATHPTKGVCGGPMSPPIRGRQTGLWLRTCRECFATAGTTEAPANVADRGPIGFARKGDLPFASMETITRRTVDELRDARQRQAGSDT